MNNNLPTLTDLHHDVQAAFKNDDLNLLLNQSPPENWLKKHPMASNVTYLPIDKVEFMLTRIFQKWRVEILREGQMFNAVYTTVRLHYLNPISGEWEYHDGVGAVDVQTEKGASPADLSKINSSAVMKALPAAVSYAIKDAAEHLGALFGRDLNRKDVVHFTGTYKREDAFDISSIKSEQDALKAMAAGKIDADQYNNLVAKFKTVAA